MVFLSVEKLWMLLFININNLDLLNSETKTICSNLILESEMDGFNIDINII
jgi:hypothetical protein